MLKIPRNDCARPALCPVGTRQHASNGIHIQTGRVSADGEMIVVAFNDLRHGVSVS
jgi:hypothetical protein